MKMDLLRFTKEMTALMISKNVRVDDAVATEMRVQVYWDELKKLRAIFETVKKAKTTNFRANFPTVSELIELNRKVVIEHNKMVENRQFKANLMISAPNESNNGKIMFFFVSDISKKYGINVASILRTVKEKNIKIPENYLELRNEPKFLSEFRNIFMEQTNQGGSPLTKIMSEVLA